MPCNNDRCPVCKPIVKNIDTFAGAVKLMKSPAKHALENLNDDHPIVQEARHAVQVFDGDHSDIVALVLCLLLRDIKAETKEPSSRFASMMSEATEIGSFTITEDMTEEDIEKASKEALSDLLGRLKQTKH